MRSITELLGRRRLGGEGRPFKAKIRRNDRLTLVVVLYPPAHMAHKFPPQPQTGSRRTDGNTVNGVTGRLCFQRYGRIRVDSRRLKDESQEMRERKRGKR